mmetsp:Transcript_25749/g.74368  ORF Transcript_25749/g.74368 Transcript_25749/m.74368 type:complete len:215 (-) Transcript_25749:44-688(-)
MVVQDGIWHLRHCEVIEASTAALELEHQLVRVTAPHFEEELRGGVDARRPAFRAREHPVDDSQLHVADRALTVLQVALGVPVPGLVDRELRDEVRLAHELLHEAPHLFDVRLPLHVARSMARRRPALEVARLVDRRRPALRRHLRGRALRREPSGVDNLALQQPHAVVVGAHARGAHLWHGASLCRCPGGRAEPEERDGGGGGKGAEARHGACA